MHPVPHAIAADIPELIETLASAFRDDPVTCWMFDDPEQRPEQLRIWKRFCLEMGLTRGHVYSTGGNRAASIWAPPDTSLFDELWGPRMAKLMTEQLGDRAGAVMQAMAGVLQHSPSEPHFYLFILGTHAGTQGQGLGSQVLKPVLDVCDAQGLPARLESSNPRNLPFYRRHGFEVVGEIELEAGGPVIRPMHRTPR
jgi:ribosomal protein S18 acetylase RimI-like enzyme